MDKQITTHFEDIVRLKRIEGPIKSVEESILERHLKGCVQQSFTKGSKLDRGLKIDEMIDVLKKFRKY
jgi:DNA-binding FrmR family transcriptional regulator